MLPQSLGEEVGNRAGSVVYIPPQPQGRLHARHEGEGRAQDEQCQELPEGPEGRKLSLGILMFFKEKAFPSGIFSEAPLRDDPWLFTLLYLLVGVSAYSLFWVNQGLSIPWGEGIPRKASSLAEVSRNSRYLSNMEKNSCC